MSVPRMLVKLSLQSFMILFELLVLLKEEVLVIIQGIFLMLDFLHFLP